MEAIKQSNPSTHRMEQMEDALRDLFGFESFRPGQREIVEALAEGRDALVVMPTGHGKSLCYQLPAFVLEGVTIVVSPLIALMKDQVDALRARGLAATCINSALSASEQSLRIREMQQGAYRLVYVAPERFRHRAFVEALDDTDVALLAIDEAHCVSHWGHDFRPDYLELGEIRRRLGHPQTIALTATATKYVQQDILAQLDLAQAEVLVHGFERPNLFFEVYHARNPRDKFRRMSALIRRWAGQSVVVYCATRKQVEAVCGDLVAAGFCAAFYHAGLADAERHRIQNAWMDGRIDVLVATNAFGMGVDKPDVRAIIHYNIPGSIEAYYQEAGRAGRDKAPANCLLLYNSSDTGIHDFFIGNSFPLRSQVERVWELLRRHGSGKLRISADEIANHFKGGFFKDRIHPMGVESCLRLLARAGHLSRAYGRRGELTIHDTVPAAELRVAWNALADQREMAWKRLDRMMDYVNVPSCRHARLVRYFNAEPSFGDACGNCESCSGSPSYGEHATIFSDEEPRTLVLKILSGIARAEGRVGAHKIAEMLCGIDSRAVVSRGLDRLSTFGVLSELRKEDVLYLMDILQRHGLAERDANRCVCLTREGAQIVRGRGAYPPALKRQLGQVVRQR